MKFTDNKNADKMSSIFMWGGPMVHQGLEYHVEEVMDEVHVEEVMDEVHVEEVMDKLQSPVYDKIKPPVCHKIFYDEVF